MNSPSEVESENDDEGAKGQSDLGQGSGLRYLGWRGFFPKQGWDSGQNEGEYEQSCIGASHAGHGKQKAYPKSTELMGAEPCPQASEGKKDQQVVFETADGIPEVGIVHAAKYNGDGGSEPIAREKMPSDGEKERKVEHGKGNGNADGHANEVGSEALRQGVEGG